MGISDIGIGECVRRVWEVEGRVGRENGGDYSIFLGRLAVTEQSGRDTDTDRGF